MPLPIDRLATQPTPLDDRIPTIYVEAVHLNRALARLRFAQTGERAAIEHAAALAAETDAANRDLAAAKSRVHDLEAQLDHLAEILIGRERYIDQLQARWRLVRAGRSPLARLHRALRWLSFRLWLLSVFLLAVVIGIFLAGLIAVWLGSAILVFRAWGMMT